MSVPGKTVPTVPVPVPVRFLRHSVIIEPKTWKFHLQSPKIQDDPGTETGTVGTVFPSENQGDILKGDILKGDV